MIITVIFVYDFNRRWSIVNYYIFIYTAVNNIVNKHLFVLLAKSI